MPHNWVTSSVTKLSLRSEADPGFWSGGPSRALIPGRPRDQNSLKIGVFTWNCLKTAWFSNNLGGKGRPGSPGSASATQQWTCSSLKSPVFCAQRTVSSYLWGQEASFSAWKKNIRIPYVAGPDREEDGIKVTRKIVTQWSISTFEEQFSVSDKKMLSDKRYQIRKHTSADLWSSDERKRQWARDGLDSRRRMGRGISW